MPNHQPTIERSPQPSPLSMAWTKGKQAAWKNRWMGLMLWLFGVAIIFGYYNVSIVRETFEWLGELKLKTGWIFGVISTAIFGGLLPVVLPILFGQPQTEKGKKLFWSILISNCLFWAFKGFEVDLLYQFQAWMFGNNSDLRTVVLKVLFDMGIYAPTIGLLNCVLFYIWRDNQYSISKTRESLGENWYSYKVLPALISNFCVWCPSVIIIYNLPLALQLPVQNLILCFWVLVLVFFTSEEEGPNDYT